MFLLNKSRFNEKDIQVIEAHKNSLNMCEFVFFLFNFLTSNGIIQNGNPFKSGIIPNIIFSAIFMLISFYSIFLYIRCACYTHHDTLEAIWKSTISEKSAIFPLIISVIVCQVTVSNYFRVIALTLKNCIYFLFPTSPNFTKDHYFVLLLVLVIYSLPISATKSLKFFIVLSFLGFSFLVILLSCIIYCFAHSISKSGFDPNHNLTIFKFDSGIIESIAIFMTSYIIMPLNYPSLGNLSYPTQNRLVRAFLIALLLAFIFYNLYGIFTYFTFFNVIPENFFISENESINFFGQVCFILVIISSTPCYLNQLRFLAVKIYSRNESMQVEIWIMTGIIIFMLGVLLSGFSKPYSTIINFIREISGELLMFFIIPIMYLKAFKKRSILHLCGSFFLFLIGILSIVFSIIINFLHNVVE